MDAFTIYLIFIFAVAVTFGFFAQAGQFCPVGGLRETMNNQGAQRLWAYLAAIAIAVMGVNLIEFLQLINLDQTKPPYRSESFAYGRYIIGGFIFGFGMVLAAGCSMRNLVRIGQGSYKAIVLVVVMAITAYIMVKTSVFAEVFLPMVAPFTLSFSEAGQQDLGSLLGSADSAALMRLTLAFVLGAAILFFALRNEGFRQWRYWMSSVVVGLAIVAGFYITGAEMGQTLIEEAEFMETPPMGLGTQSFSFAAPLADTIYAGMNPDGISVITFGVVAVIGLPIGALLASLWRREFKIEGFSGTKDAGLSIVGAILVGFGSVLAMGCSVGHGLTGISTLALGSFLALASIAAGAYTGIKLEPRWR